MGGHKKTPTSGDWGQSMRLTTFPSKVPSARKSAGFLACGHILLSAPSQGSVPQWSPQISFRSQLRGSAGLTPASLVTDIACGNLTFVISYCVRALYYGTCSWAVNSNSAEPSASSVRQAPPGLTNWRVGATVSAPGRQALSSWGVAVSRAPTDTHSPPGACQPNATARRTDRSTD